MNVEEPLKIPSRILRDGLLAIVLLTLSTAQAGSFPDLWTDPLHTHPPTLTTGSALPGDETTLDCPVEVDLTQTLALGDAVDLALCHNPQIKAAWAAIKIQAAALGEARASYFPTFTGTVSRLRTTTHYPDASAADASAQGHTSYANLNWRIFDFGGRAANRHAANALLTAALREHDATLQKTLATTVGAYFDALATQAALQAREQSSQLTSQVLHATQHRENKGMAGRNDTLQADTALAKARLAEQRSRGDHAKAVSELIYALGLPQQTRLALPVQADSVSTDSLDELNRWLDVTQAQHPAISAARLQWQAAQEKITSTRSEGLPTLDFVSSRYQNGYPNQGLQTTRSNVSTVGVMLNIPFFEGFARTYKIRGAQAQADQAEAQLQEVEHQTLSAVVKAHADAQSSLANLASSETLLRVAQQGLTSSQNRYARGAADILELLSAQGSLTDAQQERVRCLSEWQSARLRLLAASGMLGHAHLQPSP